MRGSPPPGRAPDYTNAALTMGLANLVWIFMALWATFGFWAVLLAGLALNALIDRLEARMRRD